MPEPTIVNILTEMQFWSRTSCDDPGGAHGPADKLLIKLVHILAQGHPDQPIIERIVDTWEATEKWYS